MIQFNNITYTYAFTETPAVRNISFEVAPGEAMLLTGPSGCGKSTVIRLANGLAAHYFKGAITGKVSIGGIDNLDRSVGEIANDVGTLFQDPEAQFFALEVRDEIAMPLEWQALPADDIREKVQHAAEMFGITDILQNSTLALSEGQKQKVALASIMSMAPKALILDEPTANLDPESTEALIDIIHQLKQQGTAIIIADHRLYWLRDVVDKVAVMDQGEITAQGDFSILDDQNLREKHGLRQSSVKDMRDALQEVSCNGDSCISLENVSFGYKSKSIFEDVSLQLPAGKVIGIIGPNGVGKTTFALMLTGLLKASSGEFALRDKPIKPSELLDTSSIILQNTDHQLHMQSVAQEVITAGRIHGDMTQEKAQGILATYNINVLSERHPQSLSGGEKQRLVIACGEAKQPDVFILDEPTSGLDGANMQLIADSLRRFAEQGACVLLISHDLELLEAVCDSKLTLPFTTSNNSRNK